MISISFTTLCDWKWVVIRTVPSKILSWFTFKQRKRFWSVFFTTLCDWKWVVIRTVPRKILSWFTFKAAWNYWSVFLLQLCVTENGLSSEQSQVKCSVDSHSKQHETTDQYFFYNSVWLQMDCHQNSHQLVIDLSPGRSGGRIFSSRANLLCWHLFWYLSHLCVTAAAHRRRSHSAKSAGGRLQLSTHAPYVCGFAWSDTVNWCMVVWVHRMCTKMKAVSHDTSHTWYRWQIKNASRKVTATHSESQATRAENSAIQKQSTTTCSANYLEGKGLIFCG